jgi:hypothetical protein
MAKAETCKICREVHEHRGLSFDGHGVNSCSMYRNRIATFQPDWKNSDLGKLFAAAPELLKALRQYFPVANTCDCVVCNRTRAVIAKAEGKDG